MSRKLANKRVIELLKEHGDSLTQKRMVDHWIYFRSFDDMDDYKHIVERKGFEVQDQYFEEVAGREHPYGLEITREDYVDPDSIEKVTSELERLAKEYNGFYDGWGTMCIDEK